MICTGVNPAGDAGDTPPIFWLGGRQQEYPPPILLRTFGYSRPILVALRSLSLKPFSFGYKTPPIRFSQAGGQSAHKARPPNLELALTPLVIGGSVEASYWSRSLESDATVRADYALTTTTASATKINRLNRRKPRVSELLLLL